MGADIIPLLAACTGLEPSEAAAEYAAAWDEASAASEGTPNTRTFVEAVTLFRASHPFDLAELHMAWRAKQDLDDRDNSSFRNALPMPR